MFCLMALGTTGKHTYVFFDGFGYLFFFYDFASKSGSVVGKGFWERETLPRSIKIKNHIQNHKKHIFKTIKNISHFPIHKNIPASH